MSRNYYDLLGLTMDAQNEDIAKAFRKMSIKYHPMLNQDSGRSDCARKFAMVAEAFEVLSNPKLRAIFDLYGEDGLKEGGTGAFGVPGGYRFSGDPDLVFKSFFGVANPFGNIGDFGASDPSLFKLGCDPSRQQPQCASKKLTIECPLEEFYSGARKELVITNAHLGEDGQPAKSTSKTKLTWDLAPGTPPSTRVRFDRKGTTRAGYDPGDVLVDVLQEPHERFLREGDNLVHTKHISLEDALCGFHIEVETLDHRRLRLFVNDVVDPNYTKVVAGEGMPHLSDPSQKGDLILRFDVAFPPYLTEAQKQELARVLDGRTGES
eukprot:TRINITY_DN55894_c0_g1_i1.p1 TRINITY_DN55894_c0_g1~~TRINITY_DN55894_c0_g1_i1.p1  ORF type:complete len:356 (+),score=118.27 TRINITY_DN55894_c0_g1_i1:104-1069(+)